jgi:hypothetical protein
MMKKKKRGRTWKLRQVQPRAILRIGGVPVPLHFSLATLASFAEQALASVATTFDLKGESIQQAAVALAVKTAMLANAQARIQSQVIKEEADAYLLIILYCWQADLFTPDPALFPYRFEEVMSAFSPKAQIDLSVVARVFGQEPS